MAQDKFSINHEDAKILNTILGALSTHAD